MTLYSVLILVLAGGLTGLAIWAWDVACSECDKIETQKTVNNRMKEVFPVLGRVTGLKECFVCRLKYIGYEEDECPGCEIASELHLS